MEFTTCCCLNPKCTLYGKTGTPARLKFHDWNRAAPRFRCLACRRVFSASSGTAYAGIRTEPTIYQARAGGLWGGDALTQLKRLQAEAAVPEGVRSAAGRLTTRVDGDHALPFADDPLVDAVLIIDYVQG